eukprot:gb/GEZN01014009.1/.p1 GENE.gb/GEZN01014009.1/~~gb/GEZN01014009.1/.p1  ORF type:complete len:293 (-),score=41.28 gb/GEZN01014009.1/:101-907(-)
MAVAGRGLCLRCLSSTSSQAIADLSGKRALVTGGSGAIGSAIARKLAARGANVTLASRLEGPSQEVLRSLTATEKQRHSWVGLDVLDSAQLKASLLTAQQNGDGFDILVNSAGSVKDSLLVTMDERNMREMIEVHLLGSMHLVRAVLKPMLKKKDGRIIFIGSVVGMQGNVGQSAYSAAKAGLVGLTKSLSKELGPKGITVNLVVPGFIISQMTSKIMDEMGSELKKKIPLGRFGSPEDVAQLVSFLASSEASYITGQTVVVDGGLSL